MQNLVDKTYDNLFDSHSHYDDPRFAEDRDAILAELPTRGIKKIMAVGADIPSSIKSVELAKQHEYIYAAVGVHPHSAKEAADSLEKTLHGLLQETPKVKAIGEIGLDYYYDNSPREKQREVFLRQLAVAKERGLPVVIHTRDAQQDTFAILEKEQPKAVLHSYSGSAEMAKEYEKLGFYFGFTGVLTFKNARRALEAVAAISSERLLIETDCPYMAPTPLRGKRSDSTMLPYIVEAMAEIKGVSPQQMADITYKNACLFYGIDA